MTTKSSDVELGERIAAAAVEVQAAKDAATVALERRDRLVVEGVDKGLSYSAVARHAGISKAHVHKLLATSERFQADPEV